MAKLKELAVKHDVKATMTTDRVELVSRLGNLLGMMSEIKKASQFQSESNWQMYQEHKDREHSHGTAFPELCKGLTEGVFDTEAYVARLEELHKAGFGERIKELFGTRINKRKRVRDDSDGEWDFDRRFEFDPYSRMKRMEFIERRITINFEACFPGHVSPERMLKVGALVWASIQALEELGFMVAVNYVKNNRDNRRSGPTDWFATTEIKASSEYLHPATLAASFDPAFYRRINWMAMGLGHDLTDGEADHTLGSPRCSDVKVKYAGNSTIVMTSNMEGMAPNALEQALIDALVQHIEKGDTSKLDDFKGA